MKFHDQWLGIFLAAEFLGLWDSVKVKTEEGVMMAKSACLLSSLKLAIAVKSWLNDHPSTTVTRQADISKGKGESNESERADEINNLTAS